MTSYHTKTVDGHGPYLYKSWYEGGEQRWKHIGPVAEVGRGPDIDNSNTEQPPPGIPVTRGNIDDPSMRELLADIDDEETFVNLIENIGHANTKGWDGTMPDLLTWIDTDGDEELADAIDTLQTKRRRSMVSRRTSEYLPSSAEDAEEALAVIEDRLGVRVAEVDDSGTSTTLVDDDVVMPGTSDGVEKVLNAVVGTVTDPRRAPDKEKQAQIQSAVEDAVGTDAVRRAKNSVSDGDALGFAHPDRIPATGGESGHTPITELKGVGPATAEKAHSAGLLALEDYADMSALERERTRIDADPLDYAESRGELVADVASTPGEALDILEASMSMQRAGTREGFRAADEKNVFGIADTGEWEMDGLFDDASPVDEVDKTGETVTVTTESGDTAQYSHDYWAVAEPVINEYADSIIAGDDKPLKAEMAGGESVVLAPNLGDT